MNLIGYDNATAQSYSIIEKNEIYSADSKNHIMGFTNANFHMRAHNHGKF